MKKFKNKWEISENWQLVFPLLGILLSIGCGYLITSRILSSFNLDTQEFLTLYIFSTLVITYLIIQLSLFCFKKLKNRWIVNARWEYIAIFIVFAITGSTAGRISDPVMSLIGLGHDTTSAWLYWPLRIFLIFPLYQILLLIVAWIFGQYKFFYVFEKKMLSRMGMGFLFSNK